MQIDIEGKPRVVDVTVRRVVDTPAAAQGFFLVIFDETIPRGRGRATRDCATGAELEIVGHLEEELQRTRDQLHVTGRAV